MLQWWALTRLKMFYPNAPRYGNIYLMEMDICLSVMFLGFESEKVKGDLAYIPFNMSTQVQNASCPTYPLSYCQLGAPKCKCTPRITLSELSNN